MDIKTIRHELLKAQAGIDLQKVVDNFNRNALIEHLLDGPSADLRKYLEALPLDTLRKLIDDLNRNAITDKTWHSAAVEILKSDMKPAQNRSGAGLD